MISKYFEHISQDTGKFCFGINDTLKALEMGAVETLIVYENEPTVRYTLKNAQSGEETIIHLNKEGEADQSNFVAADGARPHRHDMHAAPRPGHPWPGLAGERWHGDGTPGGGGGPRR